ncbi:dioxygenase [Microtetraspora sp. NBRC 13810]|uniref:carotenoid oxygenase family protein n=1 Tax=Microtetraspora sp. NBRC 13810 TaxID=3030990 RepID=UPI0024A2718B|nr:carotenoid oxygenase family protein [Microtetraspora sp. NBRC 13810]GLW05769.1 dioxygenase [Microtetraspora sp. NBRC 13810]
MAARTRGLDPKTAVAPGDPSGEGVSLPVEGELPAGLEGCFLQAGPHPAAGGPGDSVLRGPHVFSGIRFQAGAALLCRDRLPVHRSRPLGPIPALAPTLWHTTPRRGHDGSGFGASRKGDDGPGVVAFARPVREAGSSLWHTVATYPGLGHAEHLIAGADGTVVHADPFPLDGAPLGHAVALTRRYVVIVDSPVVYSRAAALVGVRSPYVLRPDRPARVGLLPRSPTGWTEPSWLAEGLCPGLDVVNAYDDGDEIVLDAVTRPSTDETSSPHDAGRSQLRRWRLDPATGTVRETSQSADMRETCRAADVCEACRAADVCEACRAADVCEACRAADVCEACRAAGMCEACRAAGMCEACRAADVVAGVVDPRVEGRAHRYVFGVTREGDRAAVVRHDRVTGDAQGSRLEPGWRTGPPVFAPDVRCVPPPALAGGEPGCAEEGAGWILVVAWHAGHARCELRVYDARRLDVGPQAVVRLPAPLPIDRPATWLESTRVQPDDTLPVARHRRTSEPDAGPPRPRVVPG